MIPKQELNIHFRRRKRSVRLMATHMTELMFLCFLLAINFVPACSSKHLLRPPLSNGRVTAFHRHFIKDLRGGSTAYAGEEEEEEVDDEQEEEELEEEEEDEETKKERELLQSYRLTQHLYLQSRSFALRQTLVKRGLTELEHSDVSASNIAKETDWDCALSSEEHPKSCLYTLDAEVGSKVLAPVNSSEWITVVALNRLRRNDPAKIDPLWHSKYKVLLGWFGSDSQYALSAHVPATGVLFITGMLDRPWLLKMLVFAALGIAFVVALPLWEVLVQFALLQPYLWSSWAQWGRFLHAALPLKLLMLQYAFGFASTQFGKVYEKIRGQLVEAECEMLQNCVPLTILEDEEGEEEDLSSVLE